jgi:MtN3 and saliva related transmembrane protein
MTEAFLAGAASSWAVLMGIAPVLQIRRMLRERSSRQVSVGYFTILLVGFLLWIAYGAAAGILALVIPNTVALLVGAAVVIVALRLRRRPSAALTATGRAPGGTAAGVPPSRNSLRARRKRVACWWCHGLGSWACGALQRIWCRSAWGRRWPRAGAFMLRR